jgi:4-amino-4-deoxy-L-arabinose transferase-like glycosyltransferase
LVNAGITDLVPLALLISIRKRRRRGQRVWHLVCGAVVFLLVSLIAQWSLAAPTPGGRLVGVLPTVGFMFLMKAALADRGSRSEPAPVPVSAQPTGQQGPADAR